MSQPAIELSHPVAQSISHDTWAVLQWQTKLYEAGAVFAQSGDKRSLYIPTTGLWLFTFLLSWQDGGATKRILQVLFQPMNKTRAHAQLGGIGGGWDYADMSTIYPLSAGDYVQTRVYQNSGGPLNILSNSPNHPVLAAYLLP